MACFYVLPATTPAVAQVTSRRVICVLWAASSPRLWGILLVKCLLRGCTGGVSFFCVTSSYAPRAIWLRRENAWIIKNQHLFREMVITITKNNWIKYATGSERVPKRLSPSVIISSNRVCTCFVVRRFASGGSSLGYGWVMDKNHMRLSCVSVFPRIRMMPQVSGAEHP